MKPITETCVPRRDILAGGMEDRDFAAQLEKVVSEDANYRSYTDPTTFFDLTYPTSGLRELIAATFGHLTGTGGSPIVRAQTSFGGGKTHSLIALYHLASGFRPDNLDEFVNEGTSLPDGPVRIAAVVGDTLDPVSGIERDGHTAYTLWGEIASQLGDESWAAVADHDRDRTAPGTGAIRKMLAGGPAIIVLDELAQHLAQCQSGGTEDIRRQGGQIAPFLKNLSEEVDGRDDVVVVITLASSSDAYSDATADLEARFRDTGTVLARKGSDIKPADETEIAEILKQRLFESVDEQAKTDAAAEYAEFYAKAAADLGLSAQATANIVDELPSTYPFHPELIRLLDKRLGTIPKFQRTRGALRLLSRLVAETWKSDDPPALLNVADLPLGTASVQKELSERIDRHKFAEVITADIAGSSPFAARIDHERYQDRPVTARAATTVLAHSLEETAESGSPIAEVALGTLRPGDDPGLVEDALGRLHAVAWHLAYDNVRWRFQTAPNANRIVSSEAERVLNTDLRVTRSDLIAKMCRSTSNIETHVLPEDLTNVPDDAKFRLVVVDHAMLTVTDRDANDVPDVLQDARAKNTAGGPRRHRNGVGYLVADGDKVADMDALIRDMMAATRIVGDESRMSSYSESVQQQLRDIADRSHLSAHVATGRCFKHLYYPVAAKSAGDLTHIGFAPDTQGAVGERSTGGKVAAGKSWTDQVWSALIDAAKVRATSDPIGTDRLRAKVWPKNADRVRTSELLDAFWIDHSAQLLTDTSPVVRSVQNGITEGLWVMQDLRDATTQNGKVHSNRNTSSTPPPVPLDENVWLVDYQAAVDEGLLVTPTTARDITSVVERAGDESLTASDLRASVEKAKGADSIGKQEIRQALADGINSGAIVVEKDGERVNPGDLTGDKVGFDDLTIRRLVEDENNLETKAPKRRKFKGAPGPKLEELAAWVADGIKLGHTDGLVEVELSVEVTDETPGAANTLIMLLGSVPAITDITFDCSIEYGIDGLNGSMVVDIDGADRRQAQQKAKAVLTAAGDKSGTPLAGEATVTFHLDAPHAPDAPKLVALFDAIKTYFTSPLQLRGKVS